MAIPSGKSHQILNSRPGSDLAKMRLNLETIIGTVNGRIDVNKAMPGLFSSYILAN
jgi:hypothetical protein